MLRRETPDHHYVQSGSTRLMEHVENPTSHRGEDEVTDWLRRHLIGVLGGLLSVSWCVHLYLLLAAARRDDVIYRNFEFVVVVVHELLVVALVGYSRLRSNR